MLTRAWFYCLVLQILVLHSCTREKKNDLKPEYHPAWRALIILKDMMQEKLPFVSVMSPLFKHSSSVHKSIHSWNFGRSLLGLLQSLKRLPESLLHCVPLPCSKYIAFRNVQQLVFLNPCGVLQPPPQDVLGKECIKWYVKQSVTQASFVNIQTSHSPLQHIRRVPFVASYACSTVLCTDLHKSLCYVVCWSSCLFLGKPVGFSYS